MLRPVTDETFHELVREKMEPILVYFLNENQLSHRVLLDRVKDYSLMAGQDITVLTGSLDENEETLTDLNIKENPSLVLFSDGMVRDVLTGPNHTKEDIRLWVQENI